MDVREAIAVITNELDRQECDGTLPRLLREAYNMAIVALQTQEGNLFLDSVDGSFQIGTINGNVIMGM